LTRFAGGEKEAAQVKALLADARLLTPTGPGGCGKTRLAIDVAASLGEVHGDDVCWVEPVVAPIHRSILTG
jgi:predicted ATPase